MAHAHPTETIRQRVAAGFRTLGASRPDDFAESILIRDGNYCGRRFAAAPLNAIWFADDDELAFYGPGGKLLEVVEQAAAPLPQRAA